MPSKRRPVWMFENVRNRVGSMFGGPSAQSVGSVKHFSMALGLPERARLGTGSLRNLFAEEKLSQEKRQFEAEKRLAYFKKHPMAVDHGFEIPRAKKKKSIASDLRDLYGYDEDDDGDDIRLEVLSLLSAGLAGNVYPMRSHQDIPELQIAVTSALIVELARLYADMGYISRQECWGILYVNAERVRVSFSSWDDYLNAWENGNVTDAPSNDEIEKLNRRTVAKVRKIQVEWPQENIFQNLKLMRKVQSVPKIGRS